MPIDAARGATSLPSATSAPSNAVPSSPDRGFSKNRRLLRRADFQSVYSRGRKIVGRRLIVFYLRRSEAGPSRVGLTATRKTGRAVVRNRVKRLLREAAREAWERLPDGFDLVLHARAGLSTTSRRELRDEADALLQAFADRSNQPSPPTGR